MEEINQKHGTLENTSNPMAMALLDYGRANAEYIRSLQNKVEELETRLKQVSPEQVEFEKYKEEFKIFMRMNKEPIPPHGQHG